MLLFDKKAVPTLHSECKIYRIPAEFILLLLVTPVLIPLLFSLAWFIPGTYKLATWASKENGPAELLTFVFLLFGSIWGISLALWLKSRGTEFITWCFIFLFSAALLVVAMEEVSWGQQFFKFKTPEPLLEINKQDELTLHNIEGLQGNSEYFHLIFGLAGLTGIFFNLYILNNVRIPRMLVVWFSIIVAQASFDLANDFYNFGEHLKYFTRRQSEITEMLIGFSGFAYILLLNRKFKTIDKAVTNPPVLREDVMVPKHLSETEKV